VLKKDVDKIVIAVDGPAAAGKTTTCLALADMFGLSYLESGRTYRIIALEALRRETSLDDNEAAIALCDELIEQSRSASLLTSERYGSEELRSAAVNVTVSAVARIAELRQRVTQLVRLWAESHAKCVVEGRDIGTVIFPVASVKFYLTASPEVRAARRVRQERSGTYEDVLRDVRRRDEADMFRLASPLTPAGDAITIDTTELTLGQVVGRMASECQSRGMATV
jgi:cytidylate kinase